MTTTQMCVTSTPGNIHQNHECDGFSNRNFSPFIKDFVCDPLCPKLSIEYLQTVSKFFLLEK